MLTWLSYSEWSVLTNSDFCDDSLSCICGMCHVVHSWYSSSRQGFCSTRILVMSVTILLWSICHFALLGINSSTPISVAWRCCWCACGTPLTISAVAGTLLRVANTTAPCRGLLAFPPAFPLSSMNSCQLSHVKVKWSKMHFLLHWETSAFFFYTRFNLLLQSPHPFLQLLLCCCKVLAALEQIRQ